MFSAGSFMVSDLNVHVFFCFESFFECSIREWSSFIILHLIVQFPEPLIEETLFLLYTSIHVFIIVTMDNNEKDVK